MIQFRLDNHYCSDIDRFLKEQRQKQQSEANKQTHLSEKQPPQDKKENVDK